MMMIEVHSQSVSVMIECDVLICGAGPAGVAAAVSAARHGATTVILERWGYAGGMGTAGLVNIWHTSDREKQVIFGLVQELIERAASRGCIRRFDSYPHTHETHDFDPEGMKCIYDDILTECGVVPLFYCVAGEPIVEGDNVRGVLVDGKRGRRAVLAQRVIDCTGDGDIAAKAGVPFEMGNACGRVQGMTLMYRLTGIDAERVCAMSAEEEEAILAEMNSLREQGELPPFGPLCLRGYPDGLHPNMNPVAGDPLDEADLTRCTICARKQMNAYVAYWRKRAPGYENVRVLQSAPALGVRESRRISGRKTLTRDDVCGCRIQEDAVGHGFWMIDIHDPSGSGHTTWLEREGQLPAGRTYHIPYGILAPQRFHNLLVAGRCASSTHAGQASLRIQTHCMIMGQAAGTAAALSLDSNCGVGEVDIKKLQKLLREDGVYLRDAT